MRSKYKNLSAAVHTHTHTFSIFLFTFSSFFSVLLTHLGGLLVFLSAVFYGTPSSATANGAGFLRYVFRSCCCCCCWWCRFGCRCKSLALFLCLSRLAICLCIFLGNMFCGTEDDDFFFLRARLGLTADSLGMWSGVFATFLLRHQSL